MCAPDCTACCAGCGSSLRTSDGMQLLQGGFGGPEPRTLNPDKNPRLRCHAHLRAADRQRRLRLQSTVRWSARRCEVVCRLVAAAAASGFLLPGRRRAHLLLGNRIPVLDAVPCTNRPAGRIELPLEAFAYSCAVSAIALPFSTQAHAATPAVTYRVRPHQRKPLQSKSCGCGG